MTEAIVASYYNHHHHHPYHYDKHYCGVQRQGL